MSRHDSAPVAEFFGLANEIRGNWTHNQEIGERNMDDANNAFGRRCGGSAKNDEDCRNSCFNAAIGGDLTTYQSGTTPGYWDYGK